MWLIYMNLDTLILKCPHCDNYVYIHKSELNCHIFRHGIYKHSFKQIDPHMKKEECDYLSRNKLIYGCGKPFKIVKIEGKYNIEKCEYI